MALHCIFVAVLVFFADKTLRREETKKIITVYLGAGDRGGLAGVPHGHEVSGRPNGEPRQAILPQTPPGQPAAPNHPKTAVKEAEAARGGASAPVTIAPSPSRSPTAFAPAGAHPGNDTDEALSPQGGVSRIGAATGRGDAEAPGSVGGEGSGRGVNGSGGGQAEGRNSFVAAQFAYIRGLILKNLLYPPEARRMGFRGTVTVDFVILENGLVRIIRIMESSGYDVLDRTVIETIRRSQPFPKPPARAELTIPIVFKLK